MNKFKKGDWVERTERGSTDPDEVTIGKCYKVLGITKAQQLEIIDDKGRILAYMPEYFKIAKDQIVLELIKDL